jgi:hypothetical protein
MAQVLMMLDALALKRPKVRIWALSPSSPSSNRACGVLARGKRLAVALLTALSVAWAERMTAIKSSKVEA